MPNHPHDSPTEEVVKAARALIEAMDGEPDFHAEMKAADALRTALANLDKVKP